jgi:hypothetical protein
MKREIVTLKNTLVAFSVIAASVLLARSAGAITVNGTLDPAFGSPLAVQTINTGFGNSSGGDSIGGSELDAAYGVIQGGDLYLFLAGNIQNNGNHLNVFVSGGAAGQSTLNAPSTGVLATMNGSQFSPGFQATYAYDMNDYSGTLYNEEYTYGGAGLLTGGYVGSVAETSTGIGAGIPVGGGYPAYAMIGLNNTHVSTMGAAGAAADQAQAAAVNTGFEMSIPLSLIGYTGGSIQVLADINGTSPANNYLSDQFLPGLPVGTGDLGTPTFNFSSSPDYAFTVELVPEPATWSLVLLGAGAFRFWRRRQGSRQGISLGPLN